MSARPVGLLSWVALGVAERIIADTYSSLVSPLHQLSGVMPGKTVLVA